MTDGDGDVSPPAPPHAGTGPISGFSAVSGSAGGGNVRRSMKQGKEPALAGSSSTATVVSPPPSSKNLKGSEAEAVGGKRKRKKAVCYASSVSTSCSVCGKQFKNRHARCGHMRVHNKQPQQPDDQPKQQVHEEQDEELARTLQNLGQRTSNKMEGRETKGDGSTMAEDSASTSAAAEAQRKKIHMNLDLNEDAPEDDEDCGGNEGA